MEFSLVKLLTSVLLIILGLIYFFSPQKSAKIMRLMNISRDPSQTLVNQFKYGGLITAVLGMYYLLVLLGLVPMIIGY